MLLLLLLLLSPARFGRKFLLIEGGIQLLICEIVVGILIAVGIGASGNLGALLFVCLCGFVCLGGHALCCCTCQSVRPTAEVGRS
jgi:hypothetical protein